MLTRSMLCVILSLAPLGASAQSPSTVSVKVELVFPRYRDHYPDRRAVESALATRFAEHLTRSFGFLRFAPADTASPYRLTLQLDRANRNSPASTLSELGFWARLDGPEPAPQPFYWLGFRGGTLIPTPTPEVFLAEVATRLATSDSASRIVEILKLVPLTQTALSSASPPGWALPFRQLDVCMMNGTILTVVSDVQALEHVADARVGGVFTRELARTTEQQSFVGKMFAVNDALPGILRTSIANGTLRVKRVLVTTYEHDATACQNRLPGFEGAGGTP
jgi:hypothetical protein